MSNKTMLSAKDIEKIMQWSAPTALAFARKHGELKTNGIRGFGKWFVPVEVIQNEIDSELLRVQKMQIQLNVIKEGMARVQ